ncbi:hypothetical protein [Yersinia rochesterensis]|uniref:hypothetical protein n=1 Tax=Yersinia rochesterensis TaxID=1604335 RepID=UPI0011A4A994|nr:hypothetical protein [Yersinia rochesterensis]
MKALDSFTVERLEGLIGDAETWSFVKVPARELKALARIALAAKRAEPEWYVVITSVGVWQTRYKTRSEAESHIKPWHKDYWIKELYTAPQLNSPEIRKLILSEVSDFCAGLGQPGEPELPEDIQQALMNRIELVLNNCG